MTYHASQKPLCEVRTRLDTSNSLKSTKFISIGLLSQAIAEVDSNPVVLSNFVEGIWAGGRRRGGGHDKFSTKLCQQNEHTRPPSLTREEIGLAQGYLIIRCLKSTDAKRCIKELN